MQDDKPVVPLVVAIDDACEFGPKCWVHVGGVDRRIEGIGEDVEVELLDFRDMLQELVKVEVLQGTCFRVLYHTDSTACINEQHRGRCGVMAHKQGLFLELDCEDSEKMLLVQDNWAECTFLG